MSNSPTPISLYASRQIIQSPDPYKIESKITVYQPALEVIALQNQPSNPLPNNSVASLNAVVHLPWDTLPSHPLLPTLIKKGIFIEIPGPVGTEFNKCTASSQPADFGAEFTQLQYETSYLREAKHTAIGKHYCLQNRYKDVFSTDEWLFRLTDPEGILPFEGWKKQLLMWDADALGDCPYINASRIGGHNGDIITQAPLKATEGDFWKMVWQSQAVAIVMLTPFFEGKIRKCSSYFPEHVSETLSFGEHFKVDVHLHQTFDSEGCTNWQFVLQHAEETRRLYLVQCTDWIDQKSYPIECLMRLVRYSAALAHGKPLIVHCSAGIGRSGTYYACLLAYIFWKHRKGSVQINVDALVKFMRLFRPGLIQTAAQYATIFNFIHTLSGQAKGIYY